MSGIEVIACVAAVVSAFHGGAELITIIKERKEKKRRRKEKDIEQAIQERLLHSSLLDGANQVDSDSFARRQRFGLAFEKGDAIAASQLKDVVIHLQGEVIRALQIASDVDAAVLHYTRLHEASISNRVEAVKSMDDLCQRIMIATEVPRSLSFDPGIQRLVSLNQDFSNLGLQRRGSDNSLASYRTASMLPATVSIPGISAGHSTRSPPSGSMTLSPPANISQRAGSVISLAPSYRWILPYIRRDDTDNSTIRGDGMTGSTSRNDRAATRSSQFNGRSAAEPSGLLPSEGSGILPTFPVSPITYTEHEALAAEPRARELNGQPHNPMMFHRTPSVSSSGIVPNGRITPESSPSLSSRSQHDSIVQNPMKSHDREDDAPEVVTKDTEAMLEPKTQRPSLDLRQPISTSFAHFAALQGHDMFSAEPDTVWSPLSKPTAQNNFHGFCVGAWQTRHAMKEGLSIRLLPYRDVPNVPHWQCKQCEFRSKATNDSKALPYQISHASCGVRYRWLFLAKSHVRAANPASKPGDYSYACILCAAQSRGDSSVTVHANLDLLLAHIVSKHKASMLTPEVLRRTKCVVGRLAANDEDWDINLYDIKSKSTSSNIGGALVTAITGVGSTSLGTR